MAINAYAVHQRYPGNQHQYRCQLLRYTNDGYFSFDEANTRNWDLTVAKKVKFNSTSARQYLMGKSVCLRFTARLLGQ